MLTLGVLIRHQPYAPRPSNEFPLPSCRSAIKVPAMARSACLPIPALVPLFGLLGSLGTAQVSPPPKSAAVNPSLPPSMTEPASGNRLRNEKSPYLLQHQHNPVDWFAWGEEAFAKARQEHKPIFLSIGYSTCHWCHVMERESFESKTVAAYLNEHFVSIKVDREERPDVDTIYMTFVQSTSGQGGWPLNCFLTPDRQPFYGGTYFPPGSRYGRPSFLDVLHHIAELWRTRPDEVKGSAAQLHAQLESITARAATNHPALDSHALAHAARVFMNTYDATNGGFGGAPKFPQPSQPAFLLCASSRNGDAPALQMVLHTCDRMAAGGIHDQLGGGFARYSVDAHWLVPHFEKMLYDNAQLANLYLDAYTAHGASRHAETVRDILRYVLRDMTHPEGGFYSAEDADSEGKEGKFYCWTRTEVADLLSPAEFKVAARYYGLTTAGNFVDHSDPHPLPQQNVLSIVDPNLAAGEASLLESARAKLFAARSRRVRPHLDDKILASWNGLMLSAFARAYAVLGDQPYRAAAEKNLAFLRARLWDESSHTLYHRWRDHQRDQVQLLDAYAFLLAGVLDLYQATLEPRHLDFAVALADTMLAKFYDRAAGGFWQSAGSPDLILRIKEDYDGAEPSGNSVATLALLKLAAITGRTDFQTAAETTLQLFQSRLHSQPQAVPYLLLAADFASAAPRRAVIAGDPALPETRRLIAAVHASYQPGKVVMGNTGAVEPFARTLPEKDGPLVYICTGTACQAPTRDPIRIREALH